RRYGRRLASFFVLPPLARSSASRRWIRGPTPRSRRKPATPVWSVCACVSTTESMSSSARPIPRSASSRPSACFGTPASKTVRRPPSSTTYQLTIELPSRKTPGARLVAVSSSLRDPRPRLLVDHHGGPEAHPLHQRAHVGVRGPHAPVRLGDAERTHCPMDRDPVSTEPAGGETGLGGGEGEGAAAVGRVEVPAERVGDREPPGGRGRARSPDRDLEGPKHPPPQPELSVFGREVDVDHVPGPARAKRRRVELHPAEPPVRKQRRGDARPAAAVS